MGSDPFVFFKLINNDDLIAKEIQSQNLENQIKDTDCICDLKNFQHFHHFHQFELVEKDE